MVVFLPDCKTLAACSGESGPPVGEWAMAKAAWLTSEEASWRDADISSDGTLSLLSGHPELPDKNGWRYSFVVLGEDQGGSPEDAALAARDA
jgi:hypothetical protein